MNEQSYSTIFFPLRTNVDFFRREETYLDRTARVKQALVLFDRIVFQAGVYFCAVGPEGSVGGIRPDSTGGLAPAFSEEVQLDRFWAQIKAGPEEPFTTVIESSLEHYYEACFHALANDAVESGIEGVEVEWYGLTEAGQKLAKREADRDIESTDANRENYFLNKTIFDNLNYDLVMTNGLGWLASIDALNASLLKDKAERWARISEVPGFIALDVPFPYVGDLNWDQIQEFRNEPALYEFRRRLFEIEQTARKEIDSSNVDDLRELVAVQLFGDLIDEIDARRPSRTGVMKQYTADIALEIIGTFFPPMSLLGIGQTTLTAGKNLIKVDREQRSWVAAFSKMKELRPKR